MVSTKLLDPTQRQSGFTTRTESEVQGAREFQSRTDLELKGQPCIWRRDQCFGRSAPSHLGTGRKRIIVDSTDQSGNVNRSSIRPGDSKFGRKSIQPHQLGNGEFTALYLPPTKPYPRVAIITVADRRDPTRTYGSLSIPLVGKIDFPVTGQPNSKVLIKIDDRTYGPIQANNEGRVKIPVEVPPGNPVARVVSILDDNTTDEPLDLMIPKSQRVQLFPLHQSVPADPDAQIEVRALVIKPDGTPNNNAQVQFQSSTGKIVQIDSLG